MARVLLNVVAPIVALMCFAASVHFIVRPSLALLGVSHYGRGLSVLLAAAMCLLSAVLGIVAALFLFPLVLRPVISGREFWGWLGGRAPINLPGVNWLLARWYRILYGPRRV